MPSIETARGKVGPDIVEQEVVSRDAPLFATFLVKQEPGAVGLSLKVAHAQSHDGSHADETVQHHREQRAVTQADNIAGAIKGSEQLPRLLALEHRCLALLSREPHAPNGSGRIGREDAAKGQLFEPLVHRAQMLVGGSGAEAVFELLKVRSH
ncbi:MAG: hypothetical protein RL685_5264 [Pseudomonadota bacterium]